MRRMAIVLAVLLAAGLTTAVAAHAAPPDITGGKSPVAVGTDSAGNDFVFWGANNSLYEKWSSGSTWSPATEIRSFASNNAAGVNNGSNIAVAVHPNGQRDVFWQGSDNENLYELSYVPGKGWGALQDLGSNSGTDNTGWPSLSAGADRNGNDYLFYVGSANASLWEKSDVGGHWSGPVEVYSPPSSGLLGFAAPSAIRSGPSVAVQPSGRLDVFWLGFNSTTLHSDFWEVTNGSAGGKWSGAKNLGISPVAIANTGIWPAAGGNGGNDYLFWQDQSGDLRWAWQNGGTLKWTGVPDGNQLLSVGAYMPGFEAQGPAVTVHSETSMDVFWYAANSAGTPVLLELSYRNGSWASSPADRGPL